MAGFGETIREFGVKISLAFDRKKVDEVHNKIEKLGSEMRRFSLEVAGAAAAIFEFGNLSSSNARNLQQNADLLGINVENLQELAYAAKVAAGVSREELVGSLEAVSETMDKARHGDVMASEGLLRLAQAGVGADKMLAMLQDRTVTSEQVMMALSQSFKNIKDPLAAARLATEAFGGAGAKLLPFLKRGPEGIAALRREARALGVIIPKKTIDEAAEMDRQFTRMGEVFKSLGYTIGFQVLKFLKPVVEQMLAWTSHNKKFIATNIGIVLTEIGKALQEVFVIGKKAVEVFGWIIDKVGGTKRAVDLLIGAFLALKAITFATKIFSFFGSLAGVITPLIGLIGTLGGAIWAALAPLLPIIAAIGAATVAIHDLVTLMSGGSFGETWTGQAISKAGEWIGKTKDFIKGGVAKADNAARVVASGTAIGATAGAGGNEVSQQFNSTVHVTMPPGTTAPAAVAITSKAITDSHEKMMLKSKTDALRRRKY